MSPKPNTNEPAVAAVHADQLAALEDYREMRQSRELHPAAYRPCGNPPTGIAPPASWPPSSPTPPSNNPPAPPCVSRSARATIPVLSRTGNGT